jgi:hypothetical protein
MPHLIKTKIRTESLLNKKAKNSTAAAKTSKEGTQKKM